ncbi:MAG: hypothetical protein RQ756_08730 [Flavobacteriaceae bacterium]|nr:hypothetical protein [Flavobacteriaceae bacterium]
MSAIQKRIIKELKNGNTLSVKNMYLLRCSNISREIIRQFERPFNIALQRKRVDWSDEFSHGWYYEYSLNPEDLPRVKELFEKIVLGKD